MSRASVVGACIAGCVLATGCLDKAKADYDRCVERDKNYDVPGAYSACAAAVAADPKSISGQEAQKKLETLGAVVDKLKVERDEKSARDTAIKRDEPPPPIASTSPTAFIPPVVVVPFDGGMGGPYFVQAQTLYLNGDAAGARAIIEPRVFGATKGAMDEVKLMKTICVAQKDNACLRSLTKKYLH